MKKKLVKSISWVGYRVPENPDFWVPGPSLAVTTICSKAFSFKWEEHE